MSQGSGLTGSQRMTDAEIGKGMFVEIIHDYDVFENNAKGMIAVVLKPYSVNRMEGTYGREKRVVKHLVYIEEIDFYCEPRHEWIRVIDR